MMRLLSFLLLVLLLSGCLDHYQPDYSDGFAELKINGKCEKLEGFGEYITENDFSSVFHLMSNEGFVEMVIGFVNIRTELGTYILTNQKGHKEFSYGASLVTVAGHGDLLEDTYILLTDDNSITVENYQSETGTISGTFDITFHIDENHEKVNPSNPDIIELEDVHFEVYLK